MFQDLKKNGCGGGYVKLEGRGLVNRYIEVRNESGRVLFTILLETVRM